jgi:Ca2+-binding RTX toxin-like protein
MPNYVDGTIGEDHIGIGYKDINGDSVTNGIDYVYGWGGHDWIFGLNGDDRLYGMEGNDHLFGGGMDDRLTGGGGGDELSGGTGSDTAAYDDSPAGVTVSLLHGSASGGDAAGDTFDSIENLRGSSYADTLMGDNETNDLHGLNGNDTLKGYGGSDHLWGGIGNDFLYGLNSGDVLYGEDGNDTLHGGASEDTMIGGPGNDTMIGGPGNDNYYVDNVNDSVTESGGEGHDIVRTTVSYTLTPGADVEHLIPQIDDGLDPLNLTGNETGNIVWGNAGNNILNGGDGKDTLWGHLGQDSFLFDTPLDDETIIDADTNVDTILFFSVADDTIQLDDDIFSSGLAVNNSVAGSQFVIGAAAQDANHRIIYNDATGAVFYDSDGVGGTAQIQFATLDPGLALTNFDFLVVA